jgi:Uncharacterised nucleotidyltransferase
MPCNMDDLMKTLKKYSSDRSLQKEIAYIRPEAELLLCCARTNIDARYVSRLRTLLQNKFDWEYLIHVSFLHGMLPLLYWNLQATCPETVPKPILEQLRSHFQANSRRNLFLLAELIRLLDFFALSHIPAIPLKGPILAASAYGNVALRLFSDLDIMVNQRDLLRAREALVALGYRPTVEQPYGEESGYAWVRNDGKVGIDLQWRITGEALAFPLDVDQLYLRLEPLSIAGGRSLSLPLEDLLVFLCVHGCKHLWKRLNWISDVAEIVRAHPQLDWGHVMAHARRLGTERMLMIGLYLAHDLLGTILPEEVVQNARRDPMVREVAAEMHVRLFCESDVRPGVPERVALYLRMRECFRDRVRYRLWCLRRYLHIAMTPTTNDLALLPLPGLLSPLYHLFRLLRLTRMYALHPRELKKVLYNWFEHME